MKVQAIVQTLNAQMAQYLRLAFAAFKNGKINDSQESLDKLWQLRREFAQLHGMIPPGTCENAATYFGRWSPDLTPGKYQNLNNSMNFWLELATEAYERNNIPRCNSCLRSRWRYQKELANLGGLSGVTDQPEKASDIFLPRQGGESRPPDSPALVPKKPLPTSGAGERSLKPPHDLDDYLEDD